MIVPSLIDLKADEARVNDEKLVYSAFTDNKFTDLSGWVPVNAFSTDYITSCDGVRIFGGYKVFGKGGVASLFKVLPPHYSIRISFTVFQLDSWDNEVFQVYVDGALV